ncbi:MAG: hypothetical protein ABI837_17100 [Acidobacteriota bacterium]
MSHTRTVVANELATKAGANHFLSKPYGAEVMLRTLADVLPPRPVLAFPTTRRLA